MPGSCSLLKQGKVIFVGAVVEYKDGTLARRFRVTEALKGVSGDYVDLVEFPGSFHFGLGKQYLVFADPCPWERAGSRCLTSMPCSDTRQMEYAAAMLEQLRAEKNGKRVAVVYGTLEQTLEAGRGNWNEGCRRPLANILVRVQSDGKSFEASTDKFGAYAFDRLPPGKYQVSADLPPGMVLGTRFGHDPLEPFELLRRSCFENDLYALPAGRITGRVIGPDGRPLPFARVDLYRADRYQEGKAGLLGLQGETRALEGWKPFDFYHLPPGDYVLVFNPVNKEDPNAPFPMTFYPQATNLESSQIIHLFGGQQVSNADIHVSDPLPTRPVTLRLVWGSERPQDYYPPQVIVKASRGAEPFAIKNGPDAYTLKLLLNSQYTIHAEAICQQGTTGKVEGEVNLDGSSQSVSEVTLKFDRGGCVRK
jgi:hypothetical protein